MHSRTVAAAVAAVTVCVQAGCGDETSQHPSQSQARALVVHADNGTVRLAAIPKRVVSISPTATEDLFAVGAGKQVVAVDQYSNYPRQAPRTKLSYISPNAEAISTYRPDLVVMSQESSKVAPALQRLKIPVLVYRPARNLGEAYRQIDQIGVATGHRERALGVTRRMRERVEQIIASVPHGGPRPSVYHELDPSYFSATSKTFIGRIYQLLGLRNIADNASKGGEYPKLSAEYVVQADPDLIVLADTICCKQNAKTVEQRRGLRDVRAAREGHVLAVPDDLASHWGPRVVDFVQRVANEVKQIES